MGLPGMLGQKVLDILLHIIINIFLYYIFYKYLSYGVVSIAVYIKIIGILFVNIMKQRQSYM